MAPLTDSDIQRHRYITMYDDERVLDALIALRDAEGMDWWFLIVDIESGGYAAARFSDLEETIRQGKVDTLLGELVGDVLKPVEVVVEQGSATLTTVQDLAFKSRAQVAVIEDQGEFRGVVAVTSRKGLFDSSLLNLAGDFAAIPQQGVLSRRRMKAKARPGTPALNKKP